MDMRQLRYFEAVARFGSFNHAASKLAVAQPALGVQVRKLERELGAQLFTRSARGTELTDAGRTLLDSARRILADVDATRQTMRNLGGPMRGRLRVGLAPSISATIALPLIQQVRRVLPDVQLRIVENLSSALIDSLLADRLDVALAFDVRSTAGLTCRTLLQDEAMLIEPRGGRAGSGPVEFADALGRQLIMPSRSHRLRQLVDEHAKKLGLEPNIIFEVQWPTTILALVAQGLGATIMSRTAALPGRSPNVAIRALVKPRLRYPLSLVRRDSRAPSRSEKVMAEILEKIVTEAFREHMA